MPQDNNHLSNGNRRALKPGWLWWIGQFLLTALAVFFACFGISLLVASYDLSDPFSFIMTFFAASLMTLISMVMVLGLVLRMWRLRPTAEADSDEQEDDP